MRINPARYGGRRPRGLVDPRRLHLKLRVILTHAMRADTARALVEEAVETGKVPPGIEIRWLDWRKGDGGSARAGSVMPADLRGALRKFYAALTDGETRFARVRE